MTSPRHDLSHPAMEAACGPFKEVHFPHTDLSGFALFEEAQDHGLRAAEEVLAPATAVRLESILEAAMAAGTLKADGDLDDLLGRAAVALGNAWERADAGSRQMVRTLLGS